MGATTEKYRTVLTNRLGSSVVAEGDFGFCEGIASKLNDTAGYAAYVEPIEAGGPVARARQILRNEMACAIATDEAKDDRVEALYDILANFIDRGDVTERRVATLLLWAFDRGYELGERDMRDIMRS